RTKANAIAANHHAPAIVFEGNAPADILKNQRLAALLNSTAPPPTAAPLAWLGEPVAIKDPTAVTLRRQSGANVLIVGQQEEAAMRKRKHPPTNISPICCAKARRWASTSSVGSTPPPVLSARWIAARCANSTIASSSR